MQPNTYALPRSSMRPRAGARQTTLDEATLVLLQTSRMFEGARRPPIESTNAPRPIVEAQRSKKLGEKNVSVLSV